jgi:hypothetical protein
MYCSVQGTRWQEFKRSAVAWGWVFFAFLVLRIAYLLAKPALIGAYEYVFSDANSRFSVFMGILTTAVGFYYFRKHARLAYGCCEIAFGVVLAWALTEHASDPNPKLDLVALMGILYLLVRGLDNCDVGLQARRKAREQT